MLKALSIRNIVLIERLDLGFAPGLSVLTGETGAGKSILLDSLSLALGGRGERGLLRAGAAQGMVTAVFDLPSSHEAWSLLAAQGLGDDLPDHGADHGDELILRRVLEADGRSRAFINDIPVGVALLREIGEQLVEIHGQHDDRGLVNSAGHRALLDAYADSDPAVEAVRIAHGELQSIRAERMAEQAAITAAKADEDYLRFSVDELSTLDPVIGEEQDLALRRSMMMQGEKSRAVLDEILGGLVSDGGVDAQLRGAMRRLERSPGLEQASLEPILGALERASTEAGEAIAQLEALLAQLDFSPRDLEMAEERLFALRAAARKHQCSVDDLIPLKDDMERRLTAIDHGAGRLLDLERAEKTAVTAFQKAVAALTAVREKAAKALDKAVARELAPLKLEKAKFRTRLDPLPEPQWTADGGERVEFEVATNPGAPFGSLMKIASGGEQARFILALKVALARRGGAVALIFDEVDRGVGGAVAEAVGERLERLADTSQVLVVTHSPQVAAAGAHHWHIEKQSRKVKGREEMVTAVSALDAAARQEEIARMLAGAEITAEARAAAARLMAR